MKFDAASARKYANPLRMNAPELVNFFEAKHPRAIGSWRELGREEYARSFTAARTAGYDIVRDLHDGIIATMADPDATGEDFAERVIPVLRSKGWLPDQSDQQIARRVNFIYETNLRIAQATGRWARIQRTKIAMPYLVGFTAKDERVRHPPKSPLADHRAFEGIVLPVDHPFWDDYFPPNGFGCRCQVVQRSRSQFAREGLAITTERELAERVSRLGAPWGFSPRRSSLDGMERAVADTNAARLEGAPPINPHSEYQAAAARWDGAMAISAQQAVEALIQKLFG